MNLVLFLAFVGLWLTYKLVQRATNLTNSELRKVPGPYFCKLTSSVSAYYFITGRVHYWLHELHLKYGPIVQFGPNNVSIITREGIDEIYTSYRFRKPELYTAFEFGGPNVGTISDRNEHAERKKLVGKLFSPSNFDNMETMVNEVGVKPLIIKLDKLVKNEEAIDMYKLFIDVYFDIVGMFTISERFDLITNDSHPVTKWMKATHKYGIINYKFPWLKYFGDWFGKADHDNAIKFCQEKLEKRKQTKSNNQHRDMLDLFLSKASINLTNSEMCGEVTIQFVAGIEAPGNTLAWLIKLLLKHPEIMKKMQQELDEVFPDKNEEITYKKVRSQCPYLEAVLFETFRIFPIAGGNIPRIVPKEGYSFEGYQLPAGIEVGMTGYAYTRSPDYWVEPDKFNPDRFFTESNQINKSHIFPFLKGHHGCLGRELALLSLYLTIATLFRRYNIISTTKDQSFTSQQYFTLQPIDSKVKVTLSHRT